MNSHMKALLLPAAALMIGTVCIDADAQNAGGDKRRASAVAENDVTLDDADIDDLISTGLFERGATDRISTPSKNAMVSVAEFNRIAKDMRAAEKNNTLKVTSAGEYSSYSKDGQIASRAASIPHSSVQPMYVDQSNTFQRTFQPRLKVENGCVPFPAVNWAGQVSGGLEASGSENGGCSSSPGQVYLRSRGYWTGTRNVCALMFSWYFPKDGNLFAGHRHDWEDIVVWTTSCSSSASVIAVLFSGHGSYKRYTDGYTFDGKQVRVKYSKTSIFTNFELSRTGHYGGQQPMISWWQMSQAARNSLNTHSFGAANVPFKDSKFDAELLKAKFW